MDSCGDDVELMCRVLKCLSSWLAAYLIPVQFLITSALLVAPFNALVRHNQSYELYIGQFIVMVSHSR